ncbi:hypothetical protein WOLCODRAFT_20252 [Wolfiporia cocos MD-104 SS10]|uniref:Uncharacterized protein n=1 Tax=Wolfiporia cocos (strain MD-104) TaxID=742152 RepID=A0A2H3J872_WOLCO|nr:hypothetical protein WOLCODRAFT_20252 [Wolfiporia cocos MD-104 SS10]
MAALFARLFGCCIRSRSHSPAQAEPDETTHLIPPTNEIPPIRAYVVDQQKINERMGTIVRAKEGKMVNVSAQLPFNLLNRAPHMLESSGTRSRSASANDDTANGHQPPTASQTRLPSDSPERSESPSLQASRSTSSLHPGDASYLPPEADPENGVRRPVFNARLVRPSSTGVWTRRGRSSTRGRPAHYGDERSAPRLTWDYKIWEPNALTTADTSPESGTDGAQLSATHPEDGAAPPDDAAESTPHPPIDADRAGDEDPGGECASEGDGDGGATPHMPAFQIEMADVGKISQSWSD